MTNFNTFCRNYPAFKVETTSADGDTLVFPQREAVKWGLIAAAVGLVGTVVFILRVMDVVQLSLSVSRIAGVCLVLLPGGVLYALSTTKVVLSKGSIQRTSSIGKIPFMSNRTALHQVQQLNRLDDTVFQIVPEKGSPWPIEGFQTRAQTNDFIDIVAEAIESQSKDPEPVKPEPVHAR